MKKYISTFLFIVLPTGLFAIAGFGLQVAQGQMKVEESILGGADIPGVTLTNGAFENAFGIGAFLYIDIIPVIDLELDFCGFEGKVVTKRFLSECSSSDLAYDLDEWNKFELKNPSTFRNMYEFWCQKLSVG